ncbi:MAG: uroporphyrinogen-III C-methyltransferase [Myxococcales bacterium]|nr:uroporphyrinogen-III C-methyltransferase [Myxococcales bacterium]
MAGMVYLVGAGPGDPGLITVRGAECLALADVVIADRLASPRLLERARPEAERIVRGARSELDQVALNRLLIEKAQAGKTVVRLKGGDPFLFGRGGEEAEALCAAGVRFEVVPGVTAALAAPAYAGIPLTHRGVAAAVTFATARESDGQDGAHLDWRALADPAMTVVLYMSVSHLEEAMIRLEAAGRPHDTPVAVIADGTRPSQRTIIGTIGDIAARAQAEGVMPPALTIIGDVVRLRDTLSWFEARPLSGRRILALASDADERAEDPALRDLGVEVVWASPLTVELLPGALADAVARRDRYGWIAFTSRHAVRAFADALATARLDGRALHTWRIASLAGATDGAVHRLLGLRSDLATRGGGEDLARELAPLAQGFGVLYPRAAEGLDGLPQTLEAAGISVDTVSAYATHIDTAAIDRALAEHRAAPFDAFAFGSPRGVGALLDPLLKQNPFARVGPLFGAIGRTTAAALSSHRIHPDVVLPVPSFPSLLAELCARLAKRHQIR